MLRSPSNIAVIYIKNFYREDISFRDAIALLFDREFEPNQVIEINFSEIAFITRSAAHQLLKEEKKIKLKYNAELRITHTNKEIDQMLDVVRESISHRKKISKADKVEFISLASERDLIRFL